MTSSRLRTTSVLALGLCCGLACTAILAPHDSVKRCGSTEECPATGDNRYVPVCRFDPDHIGGDTAKVSKICVADFKSDFTCDPDAYPPISGEDHPLKAKVTECKSLAGACDDALAGMEGCQTDMDGLCADGLEYNSDQGACINPDADVKIYRGEEFNEQAVLDQFCKGFFCDERFVCDTQSFKGVICDDTEPLGMGGCGEVWVNGMPSPVYVQGDALDSECLHGDASVDMPTFGDCP